jgi:plastocyanin
MAQLMTSRTSLVVLAALWIAALGSAGAAAKTVRIILDNLEFSPPEAAAAVGDTIEWVNRDFLAHTATAKDGKWEVVLPAGTTKQLQVKDAGTLDYYCKYHPNMTGTIKVAR